MADDLPLRCTCGKVQGVIHQCSSGLRLACYCRDCQAFAHFVERPEFLDGHGGTQVLQISPANVEIHQGLEQLTCMRMSPKGPLRWYTKCCKTLIANTLDKPTPPFAGIIWACWGVDEQQRDALLGPVAGHINGPGVVAANGSTARIDKFPAFTILRAVRRIIRSWMRDRGKPTVFFDEHGHVRAQAKILTLDERKALRARLPPPA